MLKKGTLRYISLFYIYKYMEIYSKRIQKLIFGIFTAPYYQWPQFWYKIFFHVWDGDVYKKLDLYIIRNDWAMAISSLEKENLEISK